MLIINFPAKNEDLTHVSITYQNYKLNVIKNYVCIN